MLTACFLGLGVICAVAWWQTDDWLLSHLRWLKSQDRDLQLSNRQIAVGFTVILLAEAVVFWAWEPPREVIIFFGALSTYLPLTFYLNCVVFHCGARRELIFTCVFLMGCVLTLMMSGWPRLEFVMPACMALTAWQCFDASRDPYCHYRRGLRILHRREDARRAVEAFEAACAQRPTDRRFRYHLGRALMADNQAGRGALLIGAVLSEEPSFEESLRKDALFEPDWLTPLQGKDRCEAWTSSPTA